MIELEMRYLIQLDKITTNLFLLFLVSYVCNYLVFFLYYTVN